MRDHQDTAGHGLQRRESPDRSDGSEQREPEGSQRGSGENAEYRFRDWALI